MWKCFRPASFVHHIPPGGARIGYGDRNLNCGALLVYILKRLLVENLPAISDYMAHLIRLIEFNLGHG